MSAPYIHERRPVGRAIWASVWTQTVMADRQI